MSAVGPSRELDADIFRLARKAEVWSYHDNCHIDAQIARGLWARPREQHPDYVEGWDQIATWRYRIGGTERHPKDEYGELPLLSASIDAAAALVPDDLEWHVTNTNTRRKPNNIPEHFNGWAGVYGMPMVGSECDSFAATPALALCAAALQAHHYRADVSGGSK